MSERHPHNPQFSASADSAKQASSASGEPASMRPDRGIEYWRSLEQLADGPEVRRLMAEEFPGYDPDAVRSISRRRFMKLMGASMALAGIGLSGCRRWPQEKLAPYAVRPPGTIEGVSEQYATIMELGGVAHPLLVTSFDGRPIKVEGNPSHPASRVTERYGAADAFAQASVLELYDPDRSAVVWDRSGGQMRPATWDQFAQFAGAHFQGLRMAGGAGLAILSEASSSPSLADMRQRLLAAFPQACWYEYEPLSRDNEIAGTRVAFGKALRPIYHLDKARVLVCFDDDPLGTHPAHVRYAADWAVLRRSADQGLMSRVYVAESSFSLTGAAADHRLPTSAARMEILIAALAGALNVRPAAQVSLTPEEAQFIADIVADRGRPDAPGILVTAGAHLSPTAHALVHEINVRLGAVGSTLTFIEEPDGQRPAHVQAISSLAAEIRAGRVRTLLILGGNPAYDAPADLEFDKLLAGTTSGQAGRPLSIHLSLYYNETSALCDWHLPRAHYLEAWGDGRAWDGTVSVAQPLIYPLYGGRSPIQLLAMLLGEEADGEQIVRRTLAGRGWLSGEDSEKAWRRILHDGLVAGSAAPVIGPQVATASSADAGAPPTAVEGFELRFLPDASVYDGRFANSGWLQEMPDPLSKLTWDNAALMSKLDADRLYVGNGDMVRISVGGRSLEIPVYILPGQPRNVIALPLGYGRRRAGHIGNGVGFDTYSLRTGGAMYVAAGATVEKTARRHVLAMTQDHHLIDTVGMKEREHRVGEKGQSGQIIHETTLDQLKAGGHAEGHRHVSLQLFEPPHKFNDPHAWGMAVDMSSCIGCNACVVACQAENNIPVVGKDQVLVNREMHWIRIDRYFKGSADDPNPQVAYQPMMCVHCENAPCEQVCPVAATVHDSEGLNVMVYNRCIGTRYCSNNCPYKVRRFNYFDFHSKDPRGAARPWLGMPDTQQNAAIDRVKQMVFNPDVTVRMRGVMEKCTYCVQRIQAAKIRRRNQGQDVQDGDIITACQQACPTQAIVFGDLNDPKSKVSQVRNSSRAYALLDEHLNTRPRTLHLAKVRNPAPEARNPT